MENQSDKVENFSLEIRFGNIEKAQSICFVEKKVVLDGHDRILYLLGWNIEGDSSEIDTSEVVNARDDKKYPWTLEIRFRNI